MYFTNGVPGSNGMNGRRAAVFRRARDSIEGTLKKRGFEYLLIGSITPCSLYASNLRELGERFMANLVPVSFPGYPEENLILTPEGTYPTVDFFARTGRESANIFYSQEFVRAEPYDQVMNGKTRAFWQIGFEIIGKPASQGRTELVDILVNVMNALQLRSRLKISDRRILEGLLGGMDAEEKEFILRNLDRFQNNSAAFRSKTSACAVSYLLSDIIEISRMPYAEMMVEGKKALSGYGLSLEGLETLRRLFEDAVAESDYVEPCASLLIPKGFDAYTGTIVEVLSKDDPDLGALAGGGEYEALKCEFARQGRSVPPMAGAGIGATRILEAILRGENNE